MTDLRHTLRSLARNPGFTAVAVLTLALGIGANVAVFSVVDAVLFRPLEYRDAERLVEFISLKDPGTPRERGQIGMTPAEIAVWRQQTQIFEAIEANSGRRVVIDGDDPQRLNAGLLSSGMLEFLGVAPISGRGFRSEESKAGADGVVLIGEGLWKTKFGGDPSVLGRTISVDRRPHTIVGVMPASFRFPSPAARIWLPLPDSRTPGKPETSFVGPLARLNRGLSLEEGQRRIDAVSAQLERDQPRAGGWTTRLIAHDRVRVDPATRRTLLVLLGAVGFVLIIAASNVANLFLARNVSRQKEIAVRAAIGASWMRLVRQFLVEGLVVAALGAIVAALAASWAMEGLTWISASILQWPTVFDPELNRRVLIFTMALTAVAALGCALVPALNVAGRELHPTFLAGARVVGASPRHRGISQSLAMIEVAVTFVLLLGAGLLANSFVRLVSVDPGFDSRDLLTIDLDLPEHRYSTPASHEAAYRQIVESIHGLPGVEGVIATGPIPPAGMLGGTLVIAGDPAAPARGFYDANLWYVSPDHFRFLRIPIVQGRGLEATDLSGPPVAIIDRDTAIRHWPAGNALGQRVQTYPNDAWRTIVGVVGRVTVQYGDGPQIYVPMTAETMRGASPVIRFANDATALMPLVRERVRAFDRDIIISSMSTVDENYGELYARPRVFFVLMTVFACVALALAVVGLYGILAYSVNQRRQEIGVRIALGARSAEVRRMVVREAMLPVGAGIGVGLAASFWLNRFLGTLLFGVTPHDLTTIAGVALLLLLVSFGAAFIPARHAARVDPVVALRAE
jgi:putative ABC transport system permease protein